MPLLILPQQASFIKGRNITDNIIIAQEVIHSMRKKSGRIGWMATKIDLEKAFDRLSWDFIADTLEDAHIPVSLQRIIMQCITSSSMQVLWNGHPSSSFLPQRGIRQGDPLSPYLFVLCMERLSQAICHEVHNGAWKPIHLRRGGPALSHLFFADDLLLFNLVGDSQSLLLQHLLEDFCLSSGLNVSKVKTRVFFSRNVTPQSANITCSELGFKKTDHLGKYLGVPILHKRVTKDTYHYIVDKVRAKLQGWKSRTLSLAGRIALAQSVLSTLPFYTMQTTRIPSITCAKIQSLIKQFIWGSSEHRKGISLIKWTSMCQPKQHGGCGLKDLNGQNSAFLMKIAFAVRTQHDSLWVQVLRSKYNWHDQRSHIHYNRHASYLWKNLSAVWEDLDLGCIWKVGDGRTARFWTDHWIGDLGPLNQLSFCPISDLECQRTISSFVDHDGQWKWSEFHGKLPRAILRKIHEFKPPRDHGNRDTISWRCGNRFSVKSAYNMLMEDQWDNESKLWNLAWKWKGPQRIRTFLWLVLSGKLLTNKERVRRHMTDEDTCGICGQGTEDIDHIFRHCLLAKACWSLVLSPQRLSSFFAEPFNRWLHSNLNIGSNSTLWSTTFGIICWRLWSARNIQVFTAEEVSALHLVNSALALAEHSSHALDFCNSIPSD